MAPTGYLDIHGHFTLPPSHNLALPSSDSHTSIESKLQTNDSLGIEMQILSSLPISTDLPSLRARNDHGTSIVTSHPTRFGLLASLPTDDIKACLAELDRVLALGSAPDGYAVNTMFNGVSLSDSSLDELWSRLDQMKAVVLVHPNHTGTDDDDDDDSPATRVVDSAFETCRVVVEMVFKLVFKRFPNIKFVLGHCGGALPSLASRLVSLGGETEGVMRDDVQRQLAGLYVDTAGSARSGMGPALKMVGRARVVYGSGSGEAGYTEETIREDQADVLTVEEEMGLLKGSVGTNGWVLFPWVAERAGKFGKVREMPML